MIMQPFMFHHHRNLTLVIKTLLLCCCWAPLQAWAQPRTGTQGHGSSDTSFFYTSFDGVKIHYEVHGKGRPVLLLHGFMGSAASWKKTALYQDLLQSGYMLVVPDLRGNGQSDKPHNADAYSNDAEAKDLVGLMEQLNLARYAVVGYSRGSIITARLLVLDKRVEKAVMGGMGADFTNPNWPRRIMFYRALSGDTVPELAGMVKYVHESGLDQVALACQQKEQPSTSKEELGRVSQPVLVICGDKDIDNGNADTLASLIPHAVRATVPGDHGGAVRTPEFSREVMVFLH